MKNILQKLFRNIKLKTSNIVNKQKTKADYFNYNIPGITCLCLYGPSGFGKSFSAKRRVYNLDPLTKAIILDGDTIRYYLNTDLDYSEKDRIKNNIRIAKIAYILMMQGFNIIISTQRADIAYDHLLELKRKYNNYNLIIKKEKLTQNAKYNN